MADETPPKSEIILYPSEDGRTRIECRFEGQTVWLSQKLMAELFQKDVRTINEHIQTILEDGELTADSVIRKFRITAADGKTYDTQHYRLEMILAVGYRVRSQRGTQFRQWATERLSEYLVKGFTMDDERLRNPPGPSMPDHFDELLERIRDIRASEKRMYLRLREILAMAADYQPSDEQTQTFFQTVQNKLHFAISGKTAPELIAERADASKPNMGLTTWKSGEIRKSDVTVAKNYLKENEITELNRIVTMFLDFAEDQAQRRKQIFLKDWKTKLDEFLRFNERGVLPSAGKVSREAADTKAEQEYEQFSASRRAAIEMKAEQDNLRELEDTAKKLPKSKRPKKRKDSSGDAQP